MVSIFIVCMAIAFVSFILMLANLSNKNDVTQEQKDERKSRFNIFLGLFLGGSIGSYVINRYTSAGSFLSGRQ